MLTQLDMFEMTLRLKDFASSLRKIKKFGSVQCGNVLKLNVIGIDNESSAAESGQENCVEVQDETGRAKLKLSRNDFKYYGATEGSINKIFICRVRVEYSKVC